LHAQLAARKEQQSNSQLYTKTHHQETTEEAPQPHNSQEKDAKKHRQKTEILVEEKYTLKETRDMHVRQQPTLLFRSKTRY